MGDPPFDPKIEIPLEEFTNSPEIANQADEILRVSALYGVDPAAVAMILHVQLNSTGLKDRIDDMLIQKGRYFQLHRLDEDEIAQVLLENETKDSVRFDSKRINQPRNSIDGPLFASVGPAQVQIYVALQLYPRVRAQLPSLPSNPKSLAEFLITPEGALHFVAAEIQFAQDEYAVKLNEDIRHQYGLIWFLHNAGSISNRAEIRRLALLEGKLVKPLSDYRNNNHHRLGEDWRRFFEEREANETGWSVNLEVTK